MKFKNMLSFILAGLMVFTGLPSINGEGQLKVQVIYDQDVNDTGDMKQIEPYGDVKGKDLSKMNLNNQRELLFTLDFDTYTKWPSKDKMPSDFNPKEVLEFGKNPGLNIRKLQDQGYTGKGISIAYVDQPLLEGHNEYKDLDLHYEIIGEKGEYANPSMHGPAVLSLLAGKDIGIVPDAKVYFMGTAACGADQKNEAAAFERIIELNKTLPKEEKIKIIGMSHRVADKDGYYLKNSERLRKAQEEAEKQGIMVIDCDTFEDPILLGITADKDPDNYKNYTIAKKYTSDNAKGKLCVPVARTYAAGYRQDESFYQFTQNGGQSWSVPYIVGVIAMGLQVNPELTKEEAMKYLYDSGYNFDGGKIINPEGFIEMVKVNCKKPQEIVLDKDYNTKRVTQENTVAAEEDTKQLNNGITSMLNKNIRFSTNYTTKDFKVNSLNVEEVGDSFRFTLDYQSGRDCDYNFFNPPNGDTIKKVVRNGIKKGNNKTTVSFTREEFEKLLSMDEMTIRFGFENLSNFIFFNPRQLKIK